jgi:hypothetical protein
MRNTNDGGAPTDTATVLANVTWIIDQLDGRGLSEVDDLPILELAKHIAVSTRRAA